MRCENEVMFCMLGVWSLFLLLNIFSGSQAFLYKESIHIDTLASLFGPNDCVEGRERDELCLNILFVKFIVMFW